MNGLADELLGQRKGVFIPAGEAQCRNLYACVESELVQLVCVTLPLVLGRHSWESLSPMLLGLSIYKRNKISS